MAASTVKRHDQARLGSDPRARHAFGGAGISLLLAAILILVAMSGASGRQVGTPVASPEASPVASPAVAEAPPNVTFVTGEVTIEISDEAMTPAEIESAVGHELTITVVNTGTEPHGFVIDELDVDLELEPSQEQTIEIGAPELGEYRFYSDLPGDEGLEGTLTIFI